MTGVDTRPALYAFVHEQVFKSAREAADVRGWMALYASRSGYRLEKVFTERPERPDAFASLVDAVIRDGVTCVLIPGEDHLRSLAVTADLKVRLERAADLRILPLDGN